MSQDTTLHGFYLFVATRVSDNEPISVTKVTTMSAAIKVVETGQDTASHGRWCASCSSKSTSRLGCAMLAPRAKKFGRPRVQVDVDRVAALRREGLSWSQVCRTLNVSKGALSDRSWLVGQPCETRTVMLNLFSSSDIPRRPYTGRSGHIRGHWPTSRY